MGIIAEQWLINERVHLSVQRATGVRRLTGQIGRAELGDAAALRLTRCRSVHGIGMRIDLDVAFVSADAVITSVHRLAPGRLAADRRAVEAFELRAGELSRLGAVPGAQLIQLTKGSK
ncbi:MAG: DUF192 domain-containing protein [Solirubrobacterales bacterium]|nr:DUF192 domain-containing protein [Solirubrobacterales bacterium]